MPLRLRGENRCAEPAPCTKRRDSWYDQGCSSIQSAVMFARLEAIPSMLVKGALLWCGMVMVCVPQPVHAHFILVAPDASMSQDGLGLPEKLGPCGNEWGGTPTGKVTAFAPGQTIAVTIDEVIMHPGHYRVALAVNDPSELPPEPVVTPTSTDPCGNVAVEDPPVFPIVADNMLPHTQAFTAPQTFTVTLPRNITCTKCTLQVIEYMSHHGAPCFYHHCADISIQAPAATPTPSDAIATPTPTPAPPTSTETPVEATATAMPSATPLTAPACVGDCNQSFYVSIDELVLCVQIALGERPLSACPAIDPTHQGHATINMLVAAVNNALNGCPSQSAAR